ncbi:hypothetical protein CV102_18660 [Natronococcus pandeyae]|uniref:Uncharacterized protein n=1 Tax=Natronococcus pandeyae TaxID=2055836 RepID=A0A8J8TP51_9EURY|nr:hypothetical protein [Natronococcus pandeyae]TYL37043.1 hypothetical protein CV102_18660 [Natronococcus pandeyae]
MQTLEVTDEQHAFIQQLRESIGENVVGKYGFVREQDAVQFLIDNLDDELEVEVDGESTTTAAVADTVSGAVDEKATATDLEEVSYIEDESVADDEIEADGSAEDDGTDADDDDESSSTDDSGDDGVDADEDDDSDVGDGGKADDDDMLDEMMSLLETYDEKWEESSSADYRYTVTLPDGSTTDVQTKDDVRALLFKNYR